MQQSGTRQREADMIELEQRIESQKENARLMLKALECECPDTACPVAHES
jgi:hypothetical protein